MTKELPKRKGVIKELEKFDANFFGIHKRQVLAMDPQSRIALECSFEAVLDAGLSLLELRGTRTGCFAAICFSEAEKSMLFDRIETDGFNLAGFVLSSTHLVDSLIKPSFFYFFNKNIFIEYFTDVVELW